MDRRKFHPAGVEIAPTSPVASPRAPAYFVVTRHRPDAWGRSAAKIIAQRTDIELFRRLALCIGVAGRNRPGHS
jgi:hypothetical protein